MIGQWSLRLALAAALLASSETAAAQRADAAATAATAAREPARRDSTPRSEHPLRRAVNRLPEWSAPLASLVLPGLGQARLGQGRAIAYLGAEAFLLLQYGKDLSEGHRSERDYREIARTIARRGFAASPPDTIWQYYEKLSEFIESGAFTMVPNGPTVPETDTLTFNGYQWLLAQRQFGIFGDPGSVGTQRYANALDWYEGRAVRQPYRWSWRNAQLEKDLYVRTISRTNDAYRRATLDLSAVIANHLLSAVDAFAVVRLAQLPGGAMRVSATLRLP